MLGIDVSKAELVCTLLDGTNRQHQWALTVPNTTEGVRRLLQRTPPAAP